jgi:hypothetical protein
MKAFFLYQKGKLSVYHSASSLPENLGFSVDEADELVDKDALALVYPADQAVALDGFRRCYESQKEISNYFRMAHKDGPMPGF